MKRTVKEALLAFLIVFTLMASLFAVHGFFAPKAKADMDSYIWALENDALVDFTGSKAIFIDLGLRVCTDLSNGFTLRHITRNVWLNYNYNFDLGSAARVAYLAQDHLCPHTAKRMKV